VQRGFYQHEAVRAMPHGDVLFERLPEEALAVTQAGVRAVAASPEDGGELWPRFRR